MGNIYAMQVLNRNSKPPMVKAQSSGAAFLKENVSNNNDARSFQSELRTKTKSFKKSEAPLPQRILDPYA
jgi:hypothetical protein